MRCQQFEHRLNQVLDERRDPTQDHPLRAHAEDCPTCWGLLETHARILSAYRHQNAFAGDPVAVGPTRGNRDKPRPRKRAVAWAALLATACAVPLLISSWLAVTRSNQPQVRLPKASPPRAAVAADPISSALDSRVAESAVPVETAEPFPIPWNELRELNLEWLLPDLEIPRQTETDWLSRVRQVGGSLRPLKNSVTSTFSILRRTWPGTQVAEPVGADQAFLPPESDLLV